MQEAKPALLGDSEITRVRVHDVNKRGNSEDILNVDSRGIVRVKVGCQVKSGLRIIKTFF